jgi:acyl carrier protein
METIEKKLREIMQDMKPALNQDFSIDDDFKDDVGLDSLDLTEYVARIENAFLIEVDDKDWKQLVNLKACIEYIQTKNVSYAAA